MARGLQAGFRLGEYEVAPEAGELRGPAGVAILFLRTTSCSSIHSKAGPD
jgi:hypothetical protein